MKIVLALIYCSIIVLFGSVQVLAQQKPVIFEDGIISNGAMEFNATFNDNGDFVIYSIASADWSTIVLCSSRRVNGKWGYPEILPFSGKYLDADPFFHDDQLFFISDRPRDKSDFYKKWDYRVWKVDYEDGNWGVPHPIRTDFDYLGQILYPSVSDDGSLYFTAKGDDGRNKFYKSELVDDVYVNPEVLNFTNSEGRFVDSIVSASEDFIVFSADLPGGLGGVDLWISFNLNGVWQDPINLGETVNTSSNEGQPGLSLDGQTLYFSTKSSQKDDSTEFQSIDELYRKLSGAGNGLLDIYKVDLPVEKLKKSRE